MEGRYSLVEKTAKPRELPGYLEVGAGNPRRSDHAIEDAGAEEALLLGKAVCGLEPPVKDAGLRWAEVNDQPQRAAAFNGEARAPAMSRSRALHWRA